MRKIPLLGNVLDANSVKAFWRTAAGAVYSIRKRRHLPVEYCHCYSMATAMNFANHTRCTLHSATAFAALQTAAVLSSSR